MGRKGRWKGMLKKRRKRRKTGKKQEKREDGSESNEGEREVVRKEEGKTATKMSKGGRRRMR